MKKILFVYNTRTTFTKQDLDILAEKFDVLEAFIPSPLAAITFILKHKLRDLDGIFFWFSSLNFYPIFVWAKLLNLKMIVVAGGYDVANIPSINYGGETKPLLHRLLRRFFLNSSHSIISISKSNQIDLHRILPVKKSEIIYFGFHDPKVELIPFSSRPKKIITIGAVNSVTFKRKGLCYFAELSKMLPDWEFLVIGKYDNETKAELEMIGGKNLKFSGFLSDNEFSNQICTSRFNLQLSYHEGFGVSVVDAALLGVYPIVFNRFSLPEVIGEDGTSLEFEDLKGVQEAIIKLNDSGYDPEKLKKTYLQKFPYQIKKTKLIDLVENSIST